MDNTERREDLHRDWGTFNGAIMMRDFDEVRRLYKDGFIDMKDKGGETSLHIACGRGCGDINIVKYLLDKGFDIEDEDIIKHRPIHLSASSGHKCVVEELIKRGCVLTTLTADGETAMELAAKRGLEEIADILYKTMKKDRKETIDEYMKETKLGNGSYGVVYKARYKETHKYFAIKEVNALFNEELVDSVKKEIEIYKLLPLHNNIVRYHGAIKGKYDMNIIMEFIDGGTLRSKLNEVNTLSINNIVLYTIQILDGIDFLHKSNIIHRDIKSSNILLDWKDVTKLWDFGSSRFLKIIESKSETGNTSDREMATTSAGTEYYMAPEVFNGPSYSFSADVWSLGATVFEMFTGSPPYYNLGRYIASYTIATLKKVEFNPNIPIPDDLKSFMDSMFVADPDKRANVEALLKSKFITKTNVLLPSVKYEYITHLRSGIFGYMNKYLDERLNKYFVMLQMDVSDDSNDIVLAVKSLRNNINKYQQLSIHPNIAQYYGTMIDIDGNLCIGTEYMDAGSMRDKLDKETKLSVNVIARYTKQILEGLKFLHVNNIIHGNIKAANMMLDGEGNVKLCDYGIYTELYRIKMEYMFEYRLMKYVTESAKKHSYWMAPEINIGDAPTKSSDVWSLGATVVEMLTGNPPYHEFDPDEVERTIKTTMTFDYQFEPWIPNNLNIFMDSIFVYNPEKRANVLALLESQFISEYCSRDNEVNVSLEPLNTTLSYCPRETKDAYTSEELSVDVIETNK